MDVLLYSLIVWLVAPIPLTVFLVRVHQKKKRREEMLLHLFMQGRITADELRLAGMSLPPAQQSPVPMQQAVPAVPPAAADPAQRLADAAEKAARAAEEALAGTLPPAPDAISEAAEEAGLSGAAEITAETVIESAEPETVLPAADAPAAVHADESEPESEFVSAEPEAHAETVRPAPYVQPPRPAPVYSQRRSFNVSAITVMLSVGVLLIITAGLIFVRTAWSTLSDFGRLTTLAAGSVLFFGTSALARRVWKLNRTGMAFFTLGAAFLPISVWAAGYLELLGDGLSGAGNPWLLALSFASFTVIALIAVKIYQQLGWGIAALCGLTAAYLNAAAGIVPESDRGHALYLILVAVYALLFAFCSRVLRQRQLLPLALGRAAEPFALAVTGLSFFVMFSALAVTEAPQLSSAAVFLTAFAFFAPALTERLGGACAVPTSILALIGFGQLMTPLYDSLFTYEVFDDVLGHDPFAYFSLLCIVTAVLWLILLLTNSLPETLRRGSFYAAVSLTVISLLPQLYDNGNRPILLLCASIVLLGIWIAAVRRRPMLAVSWMIAAQSWAAAKTIGFRLDALIDSEMNYTAPLCCGMFLLCFLVFVLTKRHRTFFSDLLFPISAGTAALMIPHESTAFCLMGTAVLAGFVVFYWRAALRDDMQRFEQFVYALMTPAALTAAVIALGIGVLPQAEAGSMVLLWSVLSFALGALTYLTTKKRFHAVRALLFEQLIVPPAAVAVFAELYTDGAWVVLQQLVAAAAAAGVWMLFASHGFRRLEAASFGTALFLLAEATVSALTEPSDGLIPFTVWMAAALWVIAFSVLAVIIRKRILLFVGGRTIPDVMQAAAPLTAMLLSVLLLGLELPEWKPFFFVYTVGLCVLSWFATKKEQIILPAVSSFALIFTLEALRQHCVSSGDGFVAVMLLCFAGLTVLFPYLGTVVRETEDIKRMQRRSWVLTALGGVVPFWLLTAAASGTQYEDYSSEQTAWMCFFVPVLLAGYILHLAGFAKTTEQRKTMMVISAALGMIAFWIQPLFDVTDTYFEGKLHILPIIAFGIVIRRLYGEQTGGGFLFCVGVYSMLRLSFGAMATELPADLITVLVVATVMFVASFYIRQKKWFLLGGISLILTAVYMHTKLSDGLQWWIYLLLAGLVLIAVAASNEMLKQRGDSLKSRAGRLWEDWTW